MHPVLNVAVEAANAAANIMRRQMQHVEAIPFERKARHDYVSEVDRACEEEIVRQIRRYYPDHAFLGEEGGARGATGLGDAADDLREHVRVEAARIARGPVADVAEVDADDLYALILPGGFGAAKNLCTFAVAGADCDVDPGVAALVREVHAQGKPIAAVCIAPALLAKVLGSEGPNLTIGNDAGTAGAMESLGANHVACPVTEFVVDRDRRLITSPAYMLAGSISEAAEGIEKTVGALMEMA